MACEPWREALSAAADGEDTGVDQRLLDAHLASCPDCRAFARHLDATRRQLRVGAAPRVPDLTGRILKATAVLERGGRWAVARAVLAIVAVQIIVLSAPLLWAGDAADRAAHAARHLGAFTIAYGVGLLLVVARPARARTMLPVAAVLAAALAITAVTDAASGVVPLTAEVTHVPELFSAFLLWLLAAPSPVADGSARRGDHRKLRLADDTHVDRHEDAG